MGSLVRLKKNALFVHVRAHFILFGFARLVNEENHSSFAGLVMSKIFLVVGVNHQIFKSVEK